MSKQSNAFAKSGAFLTQHLEGLKITPEEASALTGVAVRYVEGMVRGVQPPSRRWMDRLDSVTNRTSGQTWVEWQEVSK